MEGQIKIAGGLLIALAAMHIYFPWYFQWKSEFKGLSLINRQMIYVHTLFLALTLFLMGLLCLNAASELVTTVLGRKIALGLGIFWTARLLVQFFGYSPLLWRRKGFETTVHIVFSFLWFYFSFVFLRVFWS
ncbi:MAG: hypothetical protein WD490_01015 [Opitutales bacterium]